MVEYFMSTVLRAASQYIPQSSTTPRRISIRWWTAECRDAIRDRKRAQRLFGTRLTLEHLISFKRLRACAQRVILEANAHYSRPLSLVTPGLHVRFSYGVCQVNAIGPSYMVSLRAVPSLHHKETSPNTSASSFSLICSSDIYGPSFRVIKEIAETLPLNFTLRVAVAFYTIFSMDELLGALERCLNTSPGPEGIRNYLFSPSTLRQGVPTVHVNRI
jgi:hypothetical protein